DVVVQSRAVAVRVPRSAPRATPWPSAPARRSYGTIDRRVQEQRGRLRVRPPLSERGHPLNKDDRFWSAPGVLCGVVHCQPLRRAADHSLSSRIDSVALAPHVVWASAVSDGSRSVAFRRRPFPASTISHKFRYSSSEQTI